MDWDGKAVKRAGESEDLPELKAQPPRTWGIFNDLEDKKGTSPDRYNFGPGFF